MSRPQGRIAFALMAVVFRVRDCIRPPEKVLRRLGVAPGQTVLDFGCGPGGYSLAAARLVGPGGRVYAVDFNPIAIRAVRKAAAKQCLANMTAIVADTAADVPAASVDFALMHDVLHLLAEPAGVIASIRRALARKGLLCVNDHHMRKAAIIAAVCGNGHFVFSHSWGGTCCFRPVIRS